MKHIAQKIYAQVQRSEKIMVVPHQHPDGDTLGSVSAFVHWLEHMGKPYVSFCATSMSKKLTYLAHVDQISQDPAVWQDPTIDTVIVFDAGDLAYAGIDKYIAEMPNKPTIINMDHHNTNEYYGDLNMVMDTESSTTAILYRFFIYNDVKIDGPIATSLLTGLMTDTDNFTNGATSITSLLIASKLIGNGADIKRIKGSVFKDKSVGGLKLWGAVLSRLTHHNETDIVHTFVTMQDMKEHGASDEEVEGLANFMNNLQDGRAAMILKEREDGTVKGSFRTTRDDVNVAAYAKHLGGGGHKKAAGFTIEGPIESAIEHVLDAVLHVDKLALVEAN